MKTILFLILPFFFLAAQVKGVILDNNTNKPIPYVNIWVENENIGTSSNEKGEYSLDIKANKNIVFSALGYETKILNSNTIEKVILTPKVFELKEIVLELPKNSKEIEIGDSKKIHHTQLSGSKPWIYAKLFQYEEKYKETPFIKEIIFYSNSKKIKDAKIKIRIYDMKDSLPNNDILYEDLIVTVKKGMRKNKIDISNYKIKFPINGLIVGLEWLIIDENKFDFEYTDKKIKKSFVSYDPGVVINYLEEEVSFTYWGGKWIKNKKITNKNYIKNEIYHGKVFTPAINVVLSN